MQRIQWGYKWTSDHHVLDRFLAGIVVAPFIYIGVQKIGFWLG